MGINIVEIPDEKGIRADGGEFYFCAKNNVLFLAAYKEIQGQVRNM